MAKYDVVALGNALVDKEYEVSDEFLVEHGIEKGVMTLIEHDELLSLLSKLNNEYGLKKRAGGGSAANSMVTAAQYGASVFYCCRVGDDELGQFYHADLLTAGVSNRLNQKQTTGDTGRCVILVSEDAERTMCTHLGITSAFSQPDIEEDVIRTAQYLYIEGHLMYQPAAVEAILHAIGVAKASGVKIALTFSDPAVVKYARENLDSVIATGIDLLFCNEEEARLWADKSSNEQAAKALLEVTDTLVMTQGCEGAKIYSGEVVENINPFPISAEDSTGAGDTFAGAFLYGLTQGLDLATCGRIASRSAAQCVAQFGPRLTQQQQDAILTELAV